MWLHPAENNRFGARHHQADPQIRCVHHSPSLPHDTKTRLCATWRQTPVVVLMTSGYQRAANKYRHASHEARYVVINACSKSNESSLRYSHFLGSSTERLTLYNAAQNCLHGLTPIRPSYTSAPKLVTFLKENGKQNKTKQKVKCDISPSFVYLRGPLLLCLREGYRNGMPSSQVNQCGLSQSHSQKSYKKASLLLSED